MEVSRRHSDGNHCRKISEGHHNHLSRINCFPLNGLALWNRKFPSLVSGKFYPSCLAKETQNLKEQGRLPVQDCPTSLLVTESLGHLRLPVIMKRCAVTDMSNKGLVNQNIFLNSYKSVRKRWSGLKIRAKDLKQHITKQGTQMTRRHMKSYSIALLMTKM